MIVAIATPATPIWNTTTSSRSPITFSTLAITRKISGVVESPSDCSIAAIPLYITTDMIPPQTILV